MYSNKSDFDYGKRRSHGSRGSRTWDEDDRREEWKEPPRSSIRDAFDKYFKDGQSSSDYSEPYSKDYNSDTDWRNRRTSSRERSGSEKRRRALDDEDDDADFYRSQREPHDSYRQSPERFSNRNKDSKWMGSAEEGYSRRRSPEESRYSKHHDYSPHREDPHYRPAEYSRDRDSRERSRSPQRARSRDSFSKGYTPPRPKSDSFSRDHDDDYHDRSRFSLNGSSRLPTSSHRRLSPPPPPPPPAAAPDKRMSKGFQRFLEVLNMGVNVDTLTKIVTQGPPDVNVPPPSSHPPNDRPWASAPSPRQNPQYRPQTERVQIPASPPPRSNNSNGRTMSEERALESQKPPLSDNPPNFDDEHKRQQVHDVLQAIGIKLEFEELGRMSSRIQERLYGKKPTGSTSPNRNEEEVQEEMRAEYVPKLRSGSDSSSSFQENKKSAHWEERKYPYRNNSSKPEQNPSSHYQGRSPTHPQRPNPEPKPIPSHPVPPLPPGPMFNCPPSPFPAFPPNMPPALPNMLPPQQRPPFPSPYLQTPPSPGPNMFPPVGPPSAPRRHPYLNLIMIPPSEFSNFQNTQKVNNTATKTNKTASNSNNNRVNQRFRYLQEVKTDK